MSDMYIEILIPRIRSAASVLGQAALITLTGLAIVCGVVLHPLFLIAAVAFLVVDFIFLPRFNVEYEYLYVNGELTVDRIFSKSRRKRAGSYRIDQLELMAPLGSSRLEGLSRGTGIRTLDYSSHRPEAQVYVMYLTGSGQKERVLLEPNEKMLKELRLKMQGKVFMD